MSIDLNFWKCKKGMKLDSNEVYQRVCCNGEEIEGLEHLPIEAILEEIAATFAGWNQLDKCTYENEEGGSFQIYATSQALRFDCYSMSQGDRKRFSAVLSGFCCPLYDPQLGVRFDKILVRLHEEAVGYEERARQEITKLLPGLEIAVEPVEYPEGPRPLTATGELQLEIYIHRAKTLTKVTSNIFAGTFWSSRPCQCKTALLAEPETAHGILSELISKSIGRAVEDLFNRTNFSVGSKE